MKQLVPALFAVGAIMALTGAAVYITGGTMLLISIPSEPDSSHWHK